VRREALSSLSRHKGLFCLVSKRSEPKHAFSLSHPLVLFFNNINWRETHYVIIVVYALLLCIQTSLTSPYFAIDANGQLSLTQAVAPLNTGTILTISAIASDAGGRSDTAVVTIVISGRACFVLKCFAQNVLLLHVVSFLIGLNF